MKNIILIILLTSCCGSRVWAQPENFCKTLDTLVADAANKFTLARDSMVYANYEGLAWLSKIKLPGVVAARIISVQGLYYEGALFQTKKPEEMQAAYNRYKDLVSSCLAPKGFEVSYGPNFAKGLEDYRKIVYMPGLKEDDNPSSPPPHVALEVGYYKTDGTYTLILYVYGY